MGNSYNKEFQYKNYIFNIKIELDVKIEKKPDGKRWHRITINDMGFGNFYKSYEFLSDSNIAEEVGKATSLAEEYVDRHNKMSKTEEELIGLGFK